MSIETSETKALPTVDLQAPDARLGDKAPKTMEQVRAARYEAAAAAVEGGAAADGAPAVAAAKTTAEVAAAAAAAEAAKKAAGAPVTIDMDEATLKAATALSREARESKARARELEAKATELAPLVAAKALVEQGKHREAIKALGIDLNAAVAAELAGPTEAAESTAADKELARQAADLEALKARDAERTKRDEGEAAKQFEAVRQADIKAVGEYVKKEAVTYPNLAKSDKWILAAYEDATKQAPLVAKDMGKTLADLTPEELQQIVIAALGKGERERAEDAALYAPLAPTKNPVNVKVDPTPSTPSARPTTFSGDLRGGTASPVTKQRSRMTFSEAKRARRESTNG